MEQHHAWSPTAADEAFVAQQKNKIREELTRRLRHVCADFSDDDFRRLIDVMADRKLKADRQGL